MTRFQEFLQSRESECYIKDYGHGVLSFDVLKEIYSKWYFVVLEMESIQRLKVLYFRGSKERFENRCNMFLKVVNNDYYRLTLQACRLKLWLVGWAPALLSVDMLTDKIANAIRIDFIKFGCRSYDTGDNLLGNVCNEKMSKINVKEIKKARYLDFDFSKWIMKQREKILKQWRFETGND